MHIIITGGNQGIGFYLTEHLLELGNHVTVLDVEITELLKLKENTLHSFCLLSATSEIRTEYRKPFG